MKKYRKYIPVIKSKKNCIRCNKEFTVNVGTKIFCSPECRIAQYNETNGPKSNNPGLSRGTYGAVSELVVATDLMMKGYDVFRALSPNSHSDLVAIKEGEVIQYEVKSGAYAIDKDGEKRLRYATNNLGNKSLAVVTHCDNKVHYLSTIIN